MSRWNIVLWEPVLSPHKVNLCQSLISSDNVRSVTYIAQNGLGADRISQGWQVQRPTDYDYIETPTTHDVRFFIKSAPEDTVHIFSGMRTVPCIVEGLRAVCEQGKRFGIMSEPRASEGWKGLARLGQSWLTEGPLRRKVDFVLAIGRHGPAWFRSSGYDRNRIFPFAYFLPVFTEEGAGTRQPAPRVRVTFLGRLIHKKGIHIFLDALPLVSAPISVTVVGDGPEAERVKQHAGRFSGPFAYSPAIAMEQVPEILRQTDILVLPSVTRDDGWGAVVSEALMAGVAVVTTDRVGASVCLDDERRGIAVPTISARDIAAAIDHLIQNDRLTPELRNYRATWARKCLSGRSGAETLLKIFDYIYSNGPKPGFYFQN